MRRSMESITLERDCDAVLIPAGSPIVLQKGTDVVITQSLGGSYTVQVHGNLARVDGCDADALGKESVVSPVDTSEEMSLEDRVWAQLRTCYDPEIPVNIVALGLVYHCRVVPLTDGGNNIFVTMTLTAPGCGMGPVLVVDIKHKLLGLPHVNDVDVELVFDPPWNQTMMSEAARLQLGML